MTIQSIRAKNNEIMADYQDRMVALLQKAIAANGNGQATGELSDKDALFMVELTHIQRVYEANPDTSLIQAKLAFVADDYATDFSPEEFMKAMMTAIQFWGAWKPVDLAA